MEFYCLNIKLDEDIKLKLNKNIYRVKKVNDDSDYPITVISQDGKFISLYFSIDKIGYLQMNENNKIEILIGKKLLTLGVITKKYKSIMS